MSDGAVVDDGPTFEVLRNRATLERASLVPPQIDVYKRQRSG